MPAFHLGAGDRNSVLLLTQQMLYTLRTISPVPFLVFFYYYFTATILKENPYRGYPILKAIPTKVVVEYKQEER